MYVSFRNDNCIVNTIRMKIAWNASR